MNQSFQQQLNPDTNRSQPPPIQSPSQTVLSVRNQQNQVMKRKRDVIKNGRVAKKSAIRQIQLWKLFSFYSIEGQNQWVLDRLYRLMSEVYEVMLNIFLNEQKERENIQQIQTKCAQKTQQLTRIIRGIEEQLSSASAAKILENVIQSLQFIVNELLKQSMDSNQTFARQLMEKQEKSINLLVRARLAFFYQPKNQDDAIQPFSDQSFNPQITKQKSNNKNSHKNSLSFMLSELQVQKMGERLQKIKQMQIKNKLIDSIQASLHYKRRSDQIQQQNSRILSASKQQPTLTSQFLEQLSSKKQIESSVMYQQNKQILPELQEK